MTYYDVMREDVDGPYESERDGHEEWCASCRGPEPCDCGWTAIVRVEAEIERWRMKVVELGVRCSEARRLLRIAYADTHPEDVPMEVLSWLNP